MMRIKPIALTLFCFISSFTYAQYTEVINSNRPGVSRSAFSVGTNVVQFEVGPFITHEKRTPELRNDVEGFGVDFAVRYGLIWEPLELNVEGSFQNDTKTYFSNIPFEDSRANFKYLSVGAKYLIFDPYKMANTRTPNLYSWKANQRLTLKTLLPTISLYLGANYDTKNNPYVAPGVEGLSPKVMLITQHNFSNKWVFIMNFIKDRIGTDQSDFQYILTLTHAFNPNWVVFGETQGIKSDFYADNLFSFGAAYLWGRDFQIDTALTFNTKDTPSVFSVNLGASYRLDFHKDKKPTYKDYSKSAKKEAKRQSRRSKKNKKEPLHEQLLRQKKEHNQF